MKKRIISSLTLWGALFALLYFFQIHGGILIMLYLSGAAQLELYKIWEKSGRRVAPKAGTVAGTFLILAAYYLDGYVSNLVSDPWSRIAILAVCSVLFAWILFLVFPPKTRFPGEALIPTSLGILYSPFCYSSFYKSNYWKMAKVDSSSACGSLLQPSLLIWALCSLENILGNTRWLQL